MAIVGLCIEDRLMTSQFSIEKVVSEVDLLNIMEIATVLMPGLYVLGHL